MEAILERMEIRLDGMSKKLERLEEQNETLRKELHGIRSSSNQADSFALMEAKTLREVVEEIHYKVETINVKLATIESHREDEAVNKKETNHSSEDFDSGEKEESANDETDVNFQVVEIRSKTSEREMHWLTTKFHEMRPQTVIENGVSFQGRNIEEISNSIYLCFIYSVSCVLKLTNHLNFSITDPKFHFIDGTVMTGPSVIAEHFSEVFLGSGDGACSFLCSFSISNSLRLVLYCVNISRTSYGNQYFYIGFIPHNVPTDAVLLKKLNSMSPVPDFCKGEARNTSIELLATTGQLLVRGRMGAVDKDNRAVVQVDIFEMTEKLANGTLSFKSMTSNLKRTVERISRSLKRNRGLHWDDLKISCSFEIFNLLNVMLSNESFYFGSRRHNNYIPGEIRPCEGVTFFASDDTNVEGMFSFNIDSTDLCLVVAFKIGRISNSFAGAFLPRPAPSSKQELEKFMNGDHWNSHEWRKSSQAVDGELVLEIRNIRMLISLTGGEKSVLKIQIFAF